MERLRVAACKCLAAQPVQRVLAAFLFVAMVVAEAALDSRIGIPWPAPSILDLVWSASALAGVCIYAAWRRARVLAEIAGFSLVCLLFPIFADRLTYLAATLNAPLVDQTMHTLDIWIGFDWQSWAATEMRYPQLLWIQRLLYESISLVALGSMVIFALMRTGNRNYELLLIYLTGLIFTVLLFSMFPTLGPASLAGQPMLQEHIINQLRAGQFTSLVYDGIISFPSFHTIMAIAVIYTHRGIRLTFWPMLLWNGAMLITVPFGGDHYVTDMVAGGAIAALSIAVANAAANAGSVADVFDRLRRLRTGQYETGKAEPRSI